MDIYTTNNLVGWCLVRFDACRRTPEQRAEMLERLGITQLAYDWKPEHIPSFTEELTALQEHGIRLRAFKNTGGWPESARAIQENRDISAALSFLKKNYLFPDIWAAYKGEGVEGLTNPEEKYAAAAQRVSVLADAYEAIGCRLCVYGHGGWGGEPRTLVEIARRLTRKDIGIVYALQHSHPHLPDMPEAFEAMVPYLAGVVLSGVTPQGPKFLPIGQGTEDARLLDMIRQSGYTGPVAVMGHLGENSDVEKGLQRNMEGLEHFCREREVSAAQVND